MRVRELSDLRVQRSKGALSLGQNLVGRLAQVDADRQRLRDVGEVVMQIVRAETRTWIGTSCPTGLFRKASTCTFKV